MLGSAVGGQPWRLYSRPSARSWTEGRGPADLKLYRESRAGGQTSRTFLAHVENRNRRLERRIKVKGPTSPPPRTINFEDDFAKLIELPAPTGTGP